MLLYVNIRDKMKDKEVVQMYKMLIAEQDNELAMKIKSYTENAFKEIKVLEIQGNGIAVLDCLKQNQIDILVTAMELEGISGLEVIRCCREYNDRLHIVVISSYDYSDFVLEAMNNGVSAYLLKPVKMLQYRKVIEKLIKEENQKKEIYTQQYQTKRKEQEIDVLIDYSFIYTFLWNDKSTCFSEIYKEVLGIGTYGFVLNIEYVRKGEECKLDLDKDISIVYQGIKECISEVERCIVGPRIGKRVIVYVNQSELCKNEKNAISIAKKLYSYLIEHFNIDVRIGIGGTKKLEDVHDSYEEALKSLRYVSTAQVIHIKDVVPYVIPHKSYIEIEAKFLQNAKFGKIECLEYFGQILELLKPMTLYDAKNKLLELLIMVCHEARMQCDNEANNLDYLQFSKEIWKLDWEGLKAWGYAKVEYIAKSVKTSRGARKSVVIEEALEYVNENFNADLPLKKIAKQVGVTPQHFSKIFKEETNINYVEWLRTMRMEKAKEYILEGNRTIKEISFLVGYHDPNYFSRMFKKTVGKSPTEFGAPDIVSSSL